MRSPKLTAAQQLANERSMHAEAFSALAATHDRALAELVALRDDREELRRLRFRQKARAWFRLTGGTTC